jgi:hypothetical protein
MKSVLFFSLLAMFPAAAGNVHAYETDVIPTASGDLKITFIGHGTLMFTFGGKVIHVDPWSQLADYGMLPKADLVLITHELSTGMQRCTRNGNEKCTTFAGMTW